jgi:hypothetical protein
MRNSWSCTDEYRLEVWLVSCSWVTFYSYTQYRSCVWVIEFTHTHNYYAYARYRWNGSWVSECYSHTQLLRTRTIPVLPVLCCFSPQFTFIFACLLCRDSSPQAWFFSQLKKKGGFVIGMCVRMAGCGPFLFMFFFADGRCDGEGVKFGLWHALDTYVVFFVCEILFCSVKLFF